METAEPAKYWRARPWPTIGRESVASHLKSNIRLVWDYNERWYMDHLARLLAIILVPMFFIGMAGSMLVVIVTVIRDLQEVFTSDEEPNS